MFQKDSLKRAIEAGSPANACITGLNSRASTAMLNSILGMKLESARKQDLEDAAEIIKREKVNESGDLIAVLSSYGFPQIDESLLLEAFGIAYGMDWLEQYFIEHEEEINQRILKQ